MKKICERLLEERERLKLNKGQMAAAGGIANSTYTNYEEGRRSPDGDFLAAIAAAGADVQYILTGVRSASAPDAVSLSPDEKVLLDHYRHIDDKEDKSAVMKLAMRSADAAARPGTTQSRTKKAG
ncbi:helix-turn-helix domain-containing protein [Methylomonas sp. SURF-1]|uniref:Helix-turn-helix domain-containing protein n=1 Tax=Methylomonas aurea TaxID=2952224 RepID=A0ABT1UIY7_9GAMM|nr:helix-turn-helix domain-containing protein [Methylomonas sp. SURF-1]MCQ8182198.1 helix-turn-helix domain-containing protein [Methylomonas sp. SURF-1]